MYTARRLKPLLLIIFVFTGVLSLPGRGKHDDSLARADTLAAEKRYTEALDILTRLSAESPDYIEEAQKRIRRILNLTRSYNKLADTLIDTAEENPEDLDAILALLPRLRQTDASAHSENTRNAGSQVYLSVRFTKHWRDLNQIMIEARALLDRKDYTAALRAYQSAFSFYRDDFRKALAGGAAESETQKRLDTLTAGTTALGEAARTAGALTGKLTAASAAPDTAALLAAYTEAEKTHAALARLKNAALEGKSYFEREGELLKQGAADKAASDYLFMLAFLITGRMDQDVREGFLGGYDAVWNVFYPSLERALFEHSVKRYADTLAHLEQSRWPEARENAQAGNAVNAALLAALSWYGAFADTEETLRVPLFDAVVPASKGIVYLNAATLAKTYTYASDAARAGAAYARVREALAAERAGGGGLDALNVERARRGELTAAADAVENDLREAGEDLPRTAAYANKARASEPVRALADAKAALERVAPGLFKEELESAVRYYALWNKELLDTVLSLERTEKAADGFLKGLSRQNENGESYLAKYPAEALAELGGIAKQLDAALRDADSILDSYERDPARMPRVLALRTARAETLSLQKRLAELLSRRDSMTAQAEGQTTQARALREEGDRAMTEARALLTQKNFNGARQKTQTTAERYAASLSLQESEALRRVWDQDLLPLNTEIARREYEMVVGEVRELMTRARALYFSGEYEKAEEQLIRAANRWSVVNAAPDEEVTYWTGLARGALALQSGRAIPETAPLYKPMSQLLSAAQKNYEEGVSLTGEGSRDQGVKKLLRAREQAGEVRVLFPMNREAGVLDLRIDRAIDTAEFDKRFAARLAHTVSETKRGSREAYAEMQNLSEVQPEYPGLKRALYQAEIDIGLRQPPAETTTTERAAELARRAQGMLNTPAQHETALALVNEALRLNPNSALAMNVKDRLQVAMSRETITVIDQNTEQQYIRAVGELQRGNTIIALSIVQRLLQNPNNRGSVKINELLRRIEAMM